ncbi:MAG TPA: hypothetical protein VFR38_10725 [Gaiellaceae bacterium]|nr:hypothetical protein [Gaiellaceae bacterium]
MSSTTRARFRAAVVAIAPAVLLAGFVYHPYLSSPTDAAVIGAAAASDTTRWGISHILIGVGYGLVVLAFIAIRSYLREAGEERWSILALPFVVMGSTLLAILPGMEFTPLAAAETGADSEAAQEELVPWFVPLVVTGGVCFALGALGFARGVLRSGILVPNLAWLVAGALVVMAAARFVPLGASQYVIGATGVVALWPLAYEMWRHPEVGTATGTEST